MKSSSFICRQLSLLILVGAFFATSSGGLRAQDKSTNEASENLAENIATHKTWDGWNEPFKPFHIIANIYYVGVSGVSSFLITTPQGNILLDTGFENSFAQITNNIAQLGFKLSDTKIILNSHTHLDHCGGDAHLKSLTGAKIMMSKADAELLYSGGTADYTLYSTEMKAFPPAKADRILADGDQVKLGGTTLTCHLTPGHTKGCMVWTMDVTENGKVYHVLFFGSTSLLSGVRLLNNPNYPNIVEDFTSTFQKLNSLPCDVFLAPHAIFFDLGEKAKRLERGETPNPFIDHDGYHRLIKKSEQVFLDQLAREKAASGVK